MIDTLRRAQSSMVTGGLYVRVHVQGVRMCECVQGVCN